MPMIFLLSLLFFSTPEKSETGEIKEERRHGQAVCPMVSVGYWP
jgi:hypothetical protein